MGDGGLGLLRVQGEDLVRAQVVHLEERVAVGEGLGAVVPEALVEDGGRLPQGAHELHGAPQGHGCGGAGGQWAHWVPMICGIQEAQVNGDDQMPTGYMFFQCVGDKYKKL